MIYFAVLRCIEFDICNLGGSEKCGGGVTPKYMYKAYNRTWDGKYVQYGSFGVTARSEKMGIRDVYAPEASDVSSIFSMYFVGIFQIISAFILLEI